MKTHDRPGPPVHHPGNSRQGIAECLRSRHNSAFYPKNNVSNADVVNKPRIRDTGDLDLFRVVFQKPFGGHGLAILSSRISHLTVASFLKDKTQAVNVH